MCVCACVSEKEPRAFEAVVHRPHLGRRLAHERALLILALPLAVDGDHRHTRRVGADALVDVPGERDGCSCE